MPDLPTGAHDFDFLIGDWTVHNKKLQKRFAGCDSWDEFTGTQEVRPILNGLGNFDQLKTSLDGEYFEGVTMRLFSVRSKRWSLYWVDSHCGELQPPVVGEFKDGIGTFYCRDTLNGQEIDIRFIWSEITSSSVRWEQAFSADGKETWETNWIMNFQRQ